MGMDKEYGFDDLLFVRSVLHRLGAGKVKTFEDRLKSQKVQYFAQSFGVSLQYPYNLYIRGPYSPALAGDLFKMEEKKMIPSSRPFVPEILEMRLKEAKAFMADMNARRLELAATYHWLVKIAKQTPVAARAKLKVLKGADDKEAGYAVAKLREYDRIKKSRIYEA